MSQANILIIDDEDNILNIVQAYLEAEGYQVYTAKDGLMGLDIIKKKSIDLLVLDVMLPGLDGLEVLQELRQLSDVYVIMLTARTDELDKIAGLSLGADDYVTKPFSPRELVARIKAALRRLQAQPDLDKKTHIEIQNLRIDPDARLVWKNDTPIDLTAIEFDLLLALASHPGHVLSREQLIQQVWGHDFYGDERVVDVHLGHIRKKLDESSSNTSLITTVRGVGYRFEK